MPLAFLLMNKECALAHSRGTFFYFTGKQFPVKQKSRSPATPAPAYPVMPKNLLCLRQIDILFDQLIHFDVLAVDLLGISR